MRDSAVHRSAVQSSAPSARWAVRPGLVLGIVLISQLMVVLDATIVNIALPDMAVAMHFTPAGLSWVINAYTLAFGGLLLLGARAGDILGRKRVFLAGIALFSLASLAGGLSDSATMLLAARALQGAGGALAAPSALAYLMTLFQQGRERVRALGWYTAVSVGGGAVGLILGGILTQLASWRWVLFINVPIGLALLVVARQVLPDSERHPGRFDLAGALTSVTGVAALVYGLVRAASDGWSDPQAVAGFAAGAVLLATFVIVEMRAATPITPLRLFADRNRNTSYVARLLLVAGMFGVFFFLTQFVQEILHYGPLVAGFAFLPLTAALFLASQASARVLTGRFGERAVLLAGLAISTGGLAWLSDLSAHSSYLSLVGPLILFGLGNGLAFVPLTSIALTGIEPRDAGAGSGLINVMQQVGGALGLAVLVTVFSAARNGSTSGTAGFVAGADQAFAVAAAFLGVAVLLVALLVRPKPLDPEFDEVLEDLVEV